MPLRQALPSTWSSQYLLANALTTNIANESYIFSNNGVRFGLTGKTFIGLPFPFLRFYFVNDDSGTCAIKLSRVSDGALYWGGILQASTNATGQQAKSIVIPNDDINGSTIQTVAAGSVKLHCIVSGLPDSGLLPIGEAPKLGQPLVQTLSLAGGQSGEQGVGTGLSP